MMDPSGVSIAVSVAGMLDSAAVDPKWFGLACSTGTAVDMVVEHDPPNIPDVLRCCEVMALMQLPGRRVN